MKEIIKTINSWLVGLLLISCAIYVLVYSYKEQTYAIKLDWRNKIKYHDSCMYYWGQYHMWRTVEIMKAINNDSVNERKALDRMELYWKKCENYKDSFSRY